MKVMLLPTVIAGVTAFAFLLLLFNKSLSKPIEDGECEAVKIKDPICLCVGITHLAVCTVALAIGPYLGIEMWLVALIAVISLSLTTGTVSVYRHKAPEELGHCIKRAPWQLVPFMLSMFVLIIAVSKGGVTEAIANSLEGSGGVFKYGLTSFLSANIINNIPMSVLFSSVIENAEISAGLGDMYATVIGSNIGAFLTPIGALAGIMWSGILKGQGISFGYRDFLKIGATVSVPTLLSALLTLNIIL